MSGIFKTALGVFLLCVPAVHASELSVSLRPQARGAETVEEVVSRAIGMSYVPRAQVQAPGRSLRPNVRPKSRAFLTPAVAKPDSSRTSDAPSVSSEKAAEFSRWIKGFRSRALAQGVSGRTFDSAFAHVTFDPKVVARDSTQSEFVKPIWEYLDSAVSDTRVENGRAALRQHAALLNQIEAHYGVDKEIVVAVWGMETNYGTFRGTEGVIRSMASLAFDGRRRAFFEKELVAALQILEAGHTSPNNMKGSWAGAMGHTQFMPTSFQALAVDFTGDGRRDIWSDNPADALASTAHYLAKNGWVKDMPWGVEVRLPRGFDYSDLTSQRMPSAWARKGVLDTNGRPVPDYGTANILLPAGHRGAAFLVFKTFKVIKRYNAADAYAMGVGHLADRIAGGPPFKGDWPRGDRPLKRSERKELQQHLLRAGYAIGGVDGRIGPKTKNAIRDLQARRGWIPDGYVSYDMLRKLR